MSVIAWHRQSCPHLELKTSQFDPAFFLPPPISTHSRFLSLSLFSFFFSLSPYSPSCNHLTLLSLHFFFNFLISFTLPHYPISFFTFPILSLYFLFKALSLSSLSLSLFLSVFSYTHCSLHSSLCCLTLSFTGLFISLSVV